MVCLTSYPAGKASVPFTVHKMRVPQARDEEDNGSQPESANYMELVRTQTGRRPPLLRATTDLGPRTPSPNSTPSRAPLPRSTSHLPKNDEIWELRHGWEEQYNPEFLNDLSSVRPSEIVSAALLTFQGFLHVLYRKTTRDRRQTEV